MNKTIFADQGHYIVRDYIGIKPDCTFASADKAIQYAINLLNDGGNITILSGIYLLEQEIELNSNISIIGSGQSTKLKLQEHHPSGIAMIGSKLQNIQISNLSIIGAPDMIKGSGIVLDDSMHCKLTELFISRFGEYGIWIRCNSGLIEVQSCTLAGNHKAGIFLDDLMRGRYGDFIPNLVSNCRIYGGGNGIECRRSVVLNLIGCLVYQTVGAAFHIYDNSNAVLISGCRTYQTTGVGVQVEDTFEINISSNIISWSTQDGIILKNCGWGVVSANEVIDSGSLNTGLKDQSMKISDLPSPPPQMNGIILTNSKGFNVSANTVFNWGVAPRMEYGIKEDAECFSNIISFNNINYYDTAAVLSLGQDTLAEGNKGYRDLAHCRESMNGNIQSFIPELTLQLIDEQCL